MDYVPALDGVRALAVTAVLLFHAGVGWAQGGYLGVDVFFVLSGYLITTLLLAEHSGAGRISVLGFWARRARRLFPALLAMLLLVAGYAAFLAPADTVGMLRSQALATLGYGANWPAAFGSQSYFAQLAAPSPLAHTWSLAIEEQFYLLWPLLVVLVVGVARSRRLLLGLCLAGAAASATAMALLFHGGTGLDRVYYGTDTRAQDLLIGAALGTVLARVAPMAAGTPDRRQRRRHRGLQRGAAAGTVAALAGLAWLLRDAAGPPGWMFSGGFTLAAVATAAVLAGLVVAPGGAPARLLGAAPIRSVGRISYGLYLWHLPLFVILDHQRTGLLGWRLLAVRLAVTGATSIASYHLVELPIRQGRPRWGRLRRLWALPLAAGATALAVVAATVAPAAQLARPIGSATAPPHLAAGIVSPLPAEPDRASGPIRVLLVGDSLPVSLVWGLSPAAPQYDLDLATDGTIGCGLLDSGLVFIRGLVVNERGGLRSNGWVQCATWPRRWRNDVARFHPDLAVLLAGPWEVRNREIDGRWLHIGQPAFDRLERAAIVRAVNALSAPGTTVVLLTCPYIRQPEQADGQPWPDDNPARVDAYNRLLRAVASTHSGVQVVDLGAHMAVDGHFSAMIDGIQIRAADGIHFTVQGGVWLRPWLLPRLEAIGERSRLDATPGAPDPSS